MPYDGLFLPYQEKWLNLGPINGGLAQYNVTYGMIDQYLARIQRLGFHSLSYFDIGNWGTRITTNYHGPNTTCGQRPNGLPAPCPDPKGSNEYLRDYLWDALLHHGWDVFHGKWMVHKSDWVREPRPHPHLNLGCLLDNVNQHTAGGHHRHGHPGTSLAA